MKAKFKQVVAGVFCAIMLAGTAQAALAPIDVFLEGEELNLDHMDTSPYVDEDNIMVPLKPIAKALGYKVRWNKKEQCSVVKNKDYTIKVYLGEDIYTRKNNKTLGMLPPQSLGSSPEMLEDGEMYVPAKMFALMDCAVYESVRNSFVSIWRMEKDDLDPDVWPGHDSSSWTPDEIDPTVWPGCDSSSWTPLGSAPSKGEN